MSPFWILLELRMTVNYKMCKAPVTLPAPTNNAQARCPSCHTTNSVKALKGKFLLQTSVSITMLIHNI